MMMRKTCRRRIPFLTMRYLRRSGDQRLGFFAALRRQLIEFGADVREILGSYRGAGAAGLLRWTMEYHFGMIIRPLFSNDLQVLRINLNKMELQVVFRRNQSDMHILREVFVHRVYDLPVGVAPADVRMIVDLGSNIGLSALHFGATFPGSRIVCVEPVHENVKLNTANASVNEIEMEVIEAAVDADAGEVALFANEWWSSSTTTADVARSREGNSDRMESVLSMPRKAVRAITMDELCRSWEIDRIDILKVDIEGAEATLLSGDLAWLDRVMVVIIEIHRKYIDEGPVIEALKSQGFVGVEFGGPCDVFTRR